MALIILARDIVLAKEDPGLEELARAGEFTLTIHAKASREYLLNANLTRTTALFSSSMGDSFSFNCCLRLMSKVILVYSGRLRLSRQ
mmetsp:Transcript_11251/g.17386  ORF Transcript_11251/g.17386 Transcript_11251/m.17386 type:complete len:87 (+) Transcript_11251:184-444(+)